jgi:DNA-binding LacI/PurR family transcriptional regulator
MSTVRDIAKQTGVSIATVSRVLNNHPSVSPEAREKVMAAVNARRYVTSVGKRNTSIIAYVYTGESSLGSPFDSALLEAVHDALSDSNYNLMIVDLRRSRRNGESYSQMFQRLGIRGAVLRATSGSKAACKEIAQQGFPVVVVGDRHDDVRLPCVFSESRSGSREAIEYLISLGHRRIAISVNVVEDSDHVDRLAGYNDAMSDHGLDNDSQLIMRVPAHRKGGVQLIRRVVTSVDRPTAIYITDPMAAVGAMYEAQIMGLKVPGDLSIIGFDDTEFRYTTLPTMTAVCQNATNLGAEAYRVLMNQISEDTQVAGNSPAAWLEIHESTGPVADNAGSDQIK